ncbi:MAG TPA: hypothetical protein VGP06_06515 [Janthinobacterium sp.]|nr:hypothetical protein [Janthinobacterium sp.]
MTPSALLVLSLATVAVPAAVPAPPSPLPLPVSHVFLVQNSGWMEPFYSDPASQYKPLVAELVMAATRAGDAMVLASFNQALPGAPSPKALLALKVDPKTERGKVDAALAGLETARKPGSAAYADTDLKEAVGAAIGTALDRKPGLVWLFTNNKNSPNNDRATARRNREFYALIHNGADIRKALAFPLKMPVRSAHYSAGGLMVYVFAIQEQGAAQLDALLRSGRLQQVITEPPARLKPLDRDTVRLAPVKVENAPGVRFSMAPAGAAGAGILHADVEADARAPAAAIHWILENNIYPYTIAGAALAARSTLAGEEKPIRLGSERVTGLAPGKGAPLASVMQLPVAQLPGKWSAQAIAAAGSAYVMPGKIELRLSHQTLELSAAFRQRMEALFPGDPMPDIFVPPAEVQGSVAVLPLEVRVHFGLMPLLVLIGAVLALLALLGGLLFALLRPRQVRLTVDGELRTLTTRAGAVHPLYDKTGDKVGELKTTLFGNTLVNLREGAQIRLGR